MKIHRRALLAVLLAALLAGCATQPPAQRPKLVVLFVVDGLPQRQVTAYRDQLAPDGLARFLDKGAWFSDAHYGYSYTVTAAGHATLLTGAYPHRTGIIGNEWRDVQTGVLTYCTGDAGAEYIGHNTQALDGTSPRNLRVESMGDVLRREDARAKVIGISGKDRGAILPAGRDGTAYMYMASSGQFASSTYYMKEHPAWVDAFNAARPADRFFKTEWKPLLPDAAYARSLRDGQPWYGPAGGKLPQMMGVPADSEPGPAYYQALMRSPFGDQLTLDFARAAIAGERLGSDAVPDILAISLSGHDYVNHRWSAESRMSHDHLLQLDRMLQSFFQHLDATVGRGNYVAILTADHGFMPAPEHLQAQGQPAGKLSAGATMTRISTELEKRFGEPRLVPFISAGALMLDRKRIADRRLNLDEVANAARELLLADPAVAAAYTRPELEAGTRQGAPFFEQMRRSWHKDISGEVQYVLKPNWMMASSSSATHGSPHAYDTHVPIMFYGPRWVKPGRIDKRVEVADIASTVASLLALPPPSSNEGKALPLAAP
jgi:hypothetical protein